MKIIPSERETLLGATVVGFLVGVIAAICVVGFDSEYGGTIQMGQRVLNAVFMFFGGLLLAFVPFGLVPVLVMRLTRPNRSD